MIFPEILAEMRRPRDFVKVSLIIGKKIWNARRFQLV